MASVIRRASPIAFGHEAPRRHAVGDVVEPLGIEIVKVAQHAVLEELGVQHRHAVDGVAADGGEVRHPHRLLAVLVDQRHARRTVAVVRVTDAHLVEEAAVDLENDFEVTRQHRREQRHRPSLERLGQQRVVGIAEGVGRDVPRGIPVEQILVDEQSHQLRDRQSGMSVVELRGKVRVKRVEGIAHAQVQPQHVLQ